MPAKSPGAERATFAVITPPREWPAATQVVAPPAAAVSRSARTYLDTTSGLSAPPNAPRRGTWMSTALKPRSATACSNGAYATGHVELGDGRIVPVRWKWSLGVSIVTLIGCHSAPGFNGTGHAVNNAGTVVGSTNGAAWSWALGTSCSSPVVVQGITMKGALDINDLGTIVGYGWSPYRGFIKTTSYSAQLQPRPGHYSSIADAVDDANLVAGRSLIVNGVDSTVYWTGTQGPPALVLGPNNNMSYVSLSDKGRFAWSVTTSGATTGMSRKGTTTWALSIWTHGVNGCGDIVGSENGLAVLMKKVVCD